MLSLIFTALVASTPTGPSITRIDKSGAYSNDVTYTTFYDRRITQKVEKDSQPSFQFRFSCDGVDATKCQYVQNSFISAGNRIAQQLKLKSNILVQVQFHSFCQAMNQGSNCDEVNNIIGRATPAAYFPGRTSGSDWYYYPQALVKQMNLNQNLNFAAVDIFAEFNSDFDFYFKDQGIPIKTNQSDFEFVICHEMTHGLGFESNLAQYSSYYDGNGFHVTSNNDYIAPLPFAQGNSLSSATASSLAPLSIWDSFVQSANASFADLGRKITSFKQNNVPLSQFITNFETSGDPYNAARQIMQVISSGPNEIFFQTSNKQSVQLFSISGYRQGSTLVHVNESMSSTADFLMIPVMRPLLGQALDSIIAKANSKGIYGPGILGVMSTIGYPTTDSPQVGNLEIATNFGGYASSSLPKSISLNLLLAVALCLINQ
ncbi:hypothetical protein HDV04_004838 [Boothiomyces sp. JEL0838]|nr:hypothetical protein HDV04_004838 [Boothiomyces sp. JEL0838]